MIMYSVLRLQQGKFRNSISHLEAVADFKSVVDERCNYGWLQACLVCVLAQGTLEPGRFTSASPRLSLGIVLQQPSEILDLGAQTQCCNSTDTLLLE